MNLKLLPCVLLCATLAYSADKHAPLPVKLVAVKTVFIQNDAGEPKFTDAIFERLEAWGRWRVIPSRDEADIVINLDHTDKLHNYFFLKITDRQSGEVLWNARKDAAIRVWGRVSKALLSDLEKQLPTDPRYKP